METQIISCVGSKGGIGKSTLNLIMASYFHYSKKKKVVFLDLDNPQYSIYRKRLRDIQMNELTEEEQSSLYPIERTQIKGINEMIQNYYGKVDYIIIDFPGSMTEELAVGLFYLDYIFIPFSIDEFELDETAQFYNNLHKHYLVNEKARLKDVYIFFNKFEKIKANQFLQNKLELLRAGFKMMNSLVLNRTSYTRDYRSTIDSIPDNKENKPEDIKTLFNEILEITKQNQNEYQKKIK